MTNIEEMAKDTILETDDNSQSEVQKDEPGKSTAENQPLYTQEQVDNIVKGRLSRNKDKIRSLKEENKALKDDAKAAAVMGELLKKHAGIEGASSMETVKKLGEYYDIPQEEVQNLIDSTDVEDMSDKQIIESLKAKHFVENSDSDEIAEEFERIKAISPSRRTVHDRELFKQLEPKMLNMQIEQDRKWFKENVGEGFDEVIKSEEFSNFIDGTNMDVSTALKKFAELKGNSIGKKSVTPPSTGSVKSYGQENLKEIYTSEELDNLTDEDLKDPKVLERAINSLGKL